MAAMFAVLVVLPLDSSLYAVLSTMAVVALPVLFLVLVAVSSARAASRGVAESVRGGVLVALAYWVPAMIALGLSNYVIWRRVQADFAASIATADRLVAQILDEVRPDPIRLVDAVLGSIGGVVVGLLAAIVVSLVAFILTRLLTKVLHNQVAT